MVVDYGSYGEEAEMRVSELLQELAAVDADTASRWERIMELWKSSNTALTIHCDEPTADLPDTDELCFVVLGFQLAPDGTMRDELIERLTVALRCAERYPNALMADRKRRRPQARDCGGQVPHHGPECDLHL